MFIISDVVSGYSTTILTMKKLHWFSTPHRKNIISGQCTAIQNSVAVEDYIMVLSIVVNLGDVLAI